jgi:hypothetical protein
MKPIRANQWDEEAKGNQVMRSQEKIVQVTDLYTAGLSTRQIAERTGISKSVVGSIIKRASIGRDRSLSQTLGCRRSTRIPYEWSFFPLSPEKAWLLGLIYGDGSLRNDGLRITITSGDRDVINNINALFENTLGIRIRPTYCDINIDSKRLWQELSTQFALTPNKSRILSYPILAESLKSHFVRGLLDSDGWWQTDTRSPKPKLVFGYVSLSRAFVESLRTELITSVGISPKRTVLEGRGFVLKYSNLDAIKIGHWLYAKSTPRDRCERKYAFWSQFID